jgi:hypothetical protein
VASSSSSSSSSSSGRRAYAEYPQATSLTPSSLDFGLEGGELCLLALALLRLPPVQACFLH